MTALVGCVMKMRPENSVCSVKYGKQATWSMWKCVTSSYCTAKRIRTNVRLGRGMGTTRIKESNKWKSQQG
jgi:hypothetical protein